MDVGRLGHLCCAKGLRSLGRIERGHSRGQYVRRLCLHCLGGQRYRRGLLSSLRLSFAEHRRLGRRAMSRFVVCCNAWSVTLFWSSAFCNVSHDLNRSDCTVVVRGIDGALTTLG